MKKNMRRNLLIAAGVITAVVITVLALKPLTASEKAVAFETVKAERGTISNTVTATGTIEAITTVDVGTQVSGIIEHIYVDFNDRVKQGQVLARLDETPLRAQVEQSQANVDQAQAQLNFQEATYNRLKPLYEKNLIAQADFDQAVFNLENAKASLSSSKSALARAKVNLAYATIYSPIDGVVLNRAIEEGQTVAASFNTPTLFTIVNDLTQMEVQTNVDEADIGKVKEGQRVEFTVDAFLDLTFRGTVTQVRLQPVTTNNVVTYVVILSAPNPEMKLMPGMTASTTIFAEEKENTITLSGKALRFTPDMEWLKKMAGKGMGPVPGQAEKFADMGAIPAPPAAPAGATDRNRTVWVKDDKGLIRPVRITTGIENGSVVEILSGLSEGDEAVIAMNTGEKKETVVKADDRPRGPFPF